MDCVQILNIIHLPKRELMAKKTKFSMHTHPLPNPLVWPIVDRTPRDLTLNDYQCYAMSDMFHPIASLDFRWTALGLCGETGEVVEKFKKILRDCNGEIRDEHRASIKKELGDCLWYLTSVVHAYKLSLQDVYKPNLSIHFEDKYDLIFCLFDMANTIALAVRKDYRVIATVGVHDLHVSRSWKNRLAEYLYLLEQISLWMQTTLIEVATTNLDKLFDRHQRNVLGGSGDNR